MLCFKKNKNWNKTFGYVVIDLEWQKLPVFLCEKKKLHKNFKLNEGQH